MAKKYTPAPRRAGNSEAKERAACEANILASLERLERADPVLFLEALRRIDAAEMATYKIK